MADLRTLTDIWHSFAHCEDEQLFSQLYSRSKAAIFMIAYKYMKNKSEAEDVVQDAFTKIYTKRLSAKEIHNFEAWAGMLTRRICLKRIAKLDRRKTEVREISDRILMGKSVFNDAEGQIEIERISEIIKNLQPQNFTEILQSEIDGFSNEEIAKKLKKSEKYVRDRKYLARKSLKRHLRYAQLM